LFERFTDRARRVTVLAQEEARMLNHNYIGTEHVLLGLIHEGDGVACKALESLGLSLTGIRDQVNEIIGLGQQATPSGHIPFTPRAKKVLELSLREALQMGHNYIGTEHILLGLIREGEGVGCQVLVRLGADLVTVRQQVIQILSGYSGQQRHDEPRFGDTAHTRSRTAQEAEMMEQIREVRRLKEKLIDNQDFQGAADARDTEKSLVAEYKELRKKPLVVPTPTEGKLAIEEILKLSNVLNAYQINPSSELIHALFVWRAQNPA
jgi:ATP-dependent Clp protease ATP-binding subunit ClpC